MLEQHYGAKFANVPEDAVNIAACQITNACFECNRAKGSDIASIDALSGALTPLYHPRQQNWHEHFRCNGPLIEPLTAEGWVTVMLLRMNSPKRVAIRDNLLQEGRYPGK